MAQSGATNFLLGDNHIIGYYSGSGTLSNLRFSPLEPEYSSLLYYLGPLGVVMSQGAPKMETVWVSGGVTCSKRWL